MRKFLSILLAAVMVFGMSSAVFAAGSQDASFDKTYKLTNEGTVNPTEEFKFNFTPESLTDSNANLTVSDMPSIPQASVAFDDNINKATTAGLTKEVAVALKDVAWPGVGVYTYKVSEVAGNTAGVTYDDAAAYLKITVAYDQGTNTYYIAFVTMSLADDDGDGITDNKSGGFTNEYSAGSLSVTKQVTGNMGDQNKEFNVNVTLNAPEGKTMGSTVSYMEGGVLNKILPADWSADGSVTVTLKLKHNEEVVFTNLPYGVTYTVAEDDYTADAAGGYDKAKYEFSDEANKKIDSAEDSVTITNNKGIVVDTGVGTDSLPYILLLVCAAAGLGIFVAKRRRSIDG